MKLPNTRCVRYGVEEETEQNSPVWMAWMECDTCRKQREVDKKKAWDEMTTTTNQTRERCKKDTRGWYIMFLAIIIGAPILVMCLGDSSLLVGLVSMLVAVYAFWFGHFRYDHTYGFNLLMEKEMWERLYGNEVGAFRRRTKERQSEGEDDG